MSRPFQMSACRSPSESPSGSSGGAASDAVAPRVNLTPFVEELERRKAARADWQRQLRGDGRCTARPMFFSSVLFQQFQSCYGRRRMVNLIDAHAPFCVCVYHSDDIAAVTGQYGPGGDDDDDEEGNGDEEDEGEDDEEGEAAEGEEGESSGPRGEGGGADYASVAAATAGSKEKKKRRKKKQSEKKEKKSKSPVDGQASPAGASGN